MKVLKNIFVIIVLITILVVITSLLTPTQKGYEVSIDWLSRIISILTLFIIAALFAKLLGFRFKKLILEYDEIKELKKIELKSNTAFIVISIISSFLIHAIILKPLIVIILLNLNQTKNDLKIESKGIKYEKPYNYSSSSNKPYFLKVNIYGNNFTLKIKSNYKERLEHINMIEGLHKGKLGFYYIK